MYNTNIREIEANAIVNQKFNDTNNFIIWHDWLRHPGSIMIQRITENSHGHPLKNQKIFQSNKFSYAARTEGKLIIRSSLAKVGKESLRFLERI